MSATARIETIVQRQLSPLGLVVRGAFHPDAADDTAPSLPDGRPAQTVILVGHVGGAMWRAFEAGRMPGPDPLDQWVRTALAPIAEGVGAGLVMPSDGPPYLPFQQWAMRVEPVYPSPLGPLIHAEYGFWHGYRAAFLFADTLDISIPDKEGRSPCESCVDRPCLGTCPVSAFHQWPGSALADYDVPGCRAHLNTAEGEACLTSACLARAACPVGQAYRYPPGQARFHMLAFRDSTL